MKELIFEKQDERKIWDYCIHENLMMLLLKAPEWGDILKGTQVQNMRLYKEHFKELEDELYTFEVDILINHQVIKLTKIELLRYLMSLNNKESQTYAYISVNGKRENVFCTTGETRKLWKFTDNYFDSSEVSHTVPTLAIDNIFEKAVEELELWYVHKYNLMPRKPLCENGLPF